jgi:hypothetical protein
MGRVGTIYPQATAGFRFYGEFSDEISDPQFDDNELVAATREF